MHTSTRNQLTEKQVQNLTNENMNSGNNSTALSKLNGNETTISSPNSNNTLDINQKYGFITGINRLKLMKDFYFQNWY